MKRLTAKSISFLLIYSLCMSLWSPANYAYVEAETQDNVGYAIVFEVDGEEIPDPHSSIKANESIEIKPRLKKVSGDYASGDYASGDYASGDYVNDAEFTYKSLNEDVVTVERKETEKDFTLVATAKGLSETATAEIIVTWKNGENDSIKAVYTITVEPISATDVIIHKQSKVLNIKNTYNLAQDVSVLPETVSQKVAYTSDNEKVATVSESGMVTAVSEGTATITVTSTANPEVNETILIEVIDKPLSIELNAQSYSMKAFASFRLEATIHYTSGKTEIVDASKLKFQSSNSSIVNVDETGIVTAMKQTDYPKYATVTVTYDYVYKTDGGEEKDSLSTSCHFTVTPVPVESIVLKNNVTSITMAINDTYTLEPVVLPADATNPNFNVKSSDKAVTTKIVDGKVVLTAKKMAKEPVIITIYATENSQVKTTFTVNLYQTVFNVGELGVNGTDTKSDANDLNDILWYATCIDEPVTVVIPDGTYYIDNTLKVYTETNIVLSNNAIIRRTESAGDKPMLKNRTDDTTGGYGQARDIAITGGTWDGNANGKYEANCFYFGHAQNITITNTTIMNNSGAHLIEFAGVKNALVENVELYGYTLCKAEGYIGINAEKEAIQIDYCSSASASAMKPYDGTACDTITIRNCNIHDYMSGVGTHSYSAYANNIRIENNTFNNISNACIDLRNFKNVTISGNKAKNFTTFIYASGSQGTISNNSAMNGTSYKPKTSSGLLAKNVVTVSNGSNFTITNNTLQKAKSNGICVWNKSTATIKNNTIKNNKLYGIRTQGSNITLKSNKFSKNKKGLYDTYKDATVKSSDDIRAYYIDIKGSYKYSGKAIKPKIKIKNLNKKYYKVSYKNNIKVGTATVIIEGKGKVKSTLKKTFKIKK